MAASTTTADGAGGARGRDARVGRVAIAAATVEWYDFFIFGTAAALVFSGQFFPDASPAAGVLSSFATFAVGFVARPIGGIVAGNVGDRIGRKPVLIAALVLMGSASLLIAALPSFATIGIAAPILLVVLRIAQGLAVGAQWGGVMLLATEFAPPGKRGLYGSLVQMGVPLGLILANVLFVGVSLLTSDAAFQSWGWRIAFLPSALLLVLAWYVHRNVDETPEFRAAAAAQTAEQSKGAPIGRMLREHRRPLLLAVGATMVMHATFYTLVVGLLDYATRSLGLERDVVLLSVLIGSVVLAGVIPLAAGLSDRLGRARVFRVGTVVVIIAMVPTFLLVEQGTFLTLVLAGIIGQIGSSIIYGPQAALFAELFPPEVRYSGASTGYQLGSILGGGLAPFVFVLTTEAFGSSVPMGVYLTLLGVLALVSITLIERGNWASRGGAGGDESSAGDGRAAAGKAVAG